MLFPSIRLRRAALASAAPCGAGTAPPLSEHPKASPPDGISPKYEFLDGMRGLASLYVLIHHIVLVAGDKLAGLSPWMGWTRHGIWAVSVFIVLSGYCLTLPLVQHDLRLPSWKLYFLRRARRILPPYYAALALAAAANWMFPEAYLHAGDNPGTTLGSQAAHLLLYHNLHPDWIYDLNGAFWSIATEWQIYLLFPLLILPVWRRLGVVLGLFFSAALGWSLVKLTGQFQAVYYFVGLFGLGQAAAILSRSRPPWLGAPALGWTVGALLGTLLVLGALAPALLSRRLWLELNLVGLITAGFILHSALRIAAGTPGPLVRLLETKHVVGLGSFSYSLYLVHSPVLVLTHWLLLKEQPGSDDIWAYLIWSLAGSFVVAYGFYLLCERPLPRSVSPAQPSAPGLPASAS
jgi:peptidoglycan/LPS O-acetylase OafA/YrhL